eukprot:5706118-Prymnesium_polylepis.1
MTVFPRPSSPFRAPVTAPLADPTAAPAPRCCLRPPSSWREVRSCRRSGGGCTNRSVRARATPGTAT